MNNQKEIAAVLDRAAARSYVSGAQPATGKQCWFLAKLMLNHQDYLKDFEDVSNPPLTKAEASRWIDFFINY